MRTLTDIQFWFAQVKVAYAYQMEALASAKQNGEDIDESLEVRMQAAQTFINDVDWMIENTPTNLVGIVGQIYKVIAFVGTGLPDVQEFYNSQVGNTNIVIGNGVSIPLASNTIYGKVRLSVAPVLSSDPIAVGDNDPRLNAGQSGYDQRIVSGSFSSAGILTLIKGDASSVVVSGGVIMNQSASAQSGAFWIDGVAKSAGATYTGLVDNGAPAARVLVTDSDGIVKYRTLAEFSSDINIGTFTPNKAIVTNGSGSLVSSTTTATEIGYVAGVTSSLQTQLNNKQPLDADLTAIAALTANGLLRKTAGVWGMDENNYITGNQTITLSGDITGSGTTAIATTIANDAVTFGKMQNVNSAVILGRSSGGVGNIEQLTLGAGLALTAGVLSSTITQYTDAMARAAISSTATGLSYNSTTGVFSLTSGYVIPSTTEQTNWNTAYGNMIVSMGFNTSNGNLTLTQQDGGTIVQDLDGRYLIGNETITLSGDVTGSGTTAIATTISAGAVTFGKFQNISSGVILGRSAAGSGSASEITIGSGLTLSAGVLSLGTITANRAVATNVSGALVASTTTATELGYVSGVTSAIQTQIDGKQPLDATLTALAAIGSTTPGILVLTGTDSFATRVLEGSANRITINNASGSGSNPSIDIASTYAGQSTITTVGVISIGAWNGSPIADGYIVSAANWNEAYDEKINSLAWNASTGILTGNQQDGGTITASLDGRYLPLSGGTMTGYLTLVGDPVLNLHAATKQYVDNISTGIKPKGSVNAATTTALPSYTGATQTLTGTSNGALVAQDGVTLSNGDYLLVKNESGANEKYNGIYEVTEIGDGSNPYELTRVSNANTWSEIVNATVYVAGGSTLQGYTFYQTAATGGTLGTTAITWVVFSISTVYLEGSGIDITGNTISIATGGIVDSMVSASASIALSKLASVTANKALVSNSSGYVSASTTTATEIGYVAGVTSAIQTQINNKQPLDATLTALAAFNTNGLMTQTAADTFTARTLTGTTNRLDVTNGDGVSGNPTFDISATYVGQASITTLGTIVTGTWQGTAVADTYIASSGNWNSAYNNMIVSASFNTSDGVLTLTQQDSGTVTVDLDGRYAIGGSVSGTTGKIAKFTASDAVGDSIMSESGSTISINGSATLLDYLKVNSGAYPTQYASSLRVDASANGILQLGNNGTNYILAGNTATGGTLVIKTNVTDESLSTGVEVIRFTSGGSIITNSATATGESFIVGGSARVNGSIGVYSSSTTVASLISSSTSAFIGLGDSSGNFTYIGSDDGTLLIQTPSSGYSTKFSLSNTQLITFGAADTGEAHIFGGSARVNGDGIITGQLRVNGATGNINTIFDLKVSTDNNIGIRTGTSLGSFGTAIQFHNDAVSAYTIGAIEASTLLLNSVSGGNVGIGTTSPDVFSRGYSGTILGISSSGQSAIELNSATGNNAYFDMGVNGTRVFNMSADTTAASLATVSTQALVLGTNSINRLTIDGSTGAATFSSSVTSGSHTITNGNILTLVGGDIYIQEGGRGILSPDAQRLVALNNGFLTINGTTGIGVTSVGSDGGVMPRLAVGNPSNSDKFVGIVYDNTYDTGFIHSIHRATAWKNIALQAFGGQVLVGTPTTSSSDKMQIHSGSTTSLRFTSTDNTLFRGVVFGSVANDVTEYAYLKYLPQTGEFRMFGSPTGFGGFVSFYNNNIEEGRISVGGRWLIGTTTDDGVNKLQVNGGGFFTDGLGLLNSGSVSGTAIKIAGTTSAKRFLHIGTSGADSYIESASSTGGGLITGSDAYSLMFRNDIGFNFGLGTTSALKINSSGSIFSSSVTAASLIKSGGTSAQFLKADGSVDSNSYLTTGSAVLNQSIGTPQTASFDVANDSRVAGRFYIGSNGCYIQEVLIGGVYELQVVDSAGNITVIS